MLTLRTNRPIVPSVFGRDLDRFFEGMLSPAFFGTGRETQQLFPALNLHENENAYTIEAELPGFTDENIDVGVTGDMLTIRGKREAENEEEGATFHRRERWSGTFERSVRLPEQVEADKVTATLTNGVLTITLPKPEVVKPRKISVKPA